MKVPLLLKATKTNLRIFHNNKFVYTNFPFKPFNLLEESAFPEVSVSNKAIEKWTKIPDDELTNYKRVVFNDTAQQREFLDRHKDKINQIYNNSYVEQLYISDPDFILKFPHEEKIRIMFWDIETRTVGDDVFPKPEKQPIICIGFSIWDYHPDGSKEKLNYTLLNNYDEDKTDLFILQDFVEAMRKWDVDILAGYNSEIFDFPYFYNRCKIRKVSMQGFARENKSPFINDRGQIFINGRIHYDMYLKVLKDQSLYGLKNKSLKTLARHYKVPLDKDADVELEDAIRNTEKVRTENPDLLWSYQKADVIRTEHVGAVYIRNDITLAEKVQVSLNDTMNSYPSFIPKIFLARNFYKNKLISTETNFSKYNSRTGTRYQFRKYDNKELKYQGALVGLYKYGKFEDTYKLDFTSMYPSAICTFNLGPDTTKLIEVRPYTGKYKFKKTAKYDWHSFPDKNFGVDLVVRVRNDIEGILKKEIKMLWAERKAIKKEMKEAAKTNPELVPMLDSQQLAIKIILNSIYGIQGLKSSTYGDTITGATITAMCRYTTGKTIVKYEDELVELDSVTGDTPIWVKNKFMNMVDIIPIEDIHRGDAKNYEVVEPIKALTRHGWADINYTKRHEVSKNIYRTRIKNGFVDITEDHSLFNNNEEELTPKDIIVNKSHIELTDYFYIPNNNFINNELAWLYGFLLNNIKIDTYKTRFRTLKTKLILSKKYKHIKTNIVKLLNLYIGSKFECRFRTTEFRNHYELIPWGKNSFKIYEFLIKKLYTKNGYSKVPIDIINNVEKGDAFIGGLLADSTYAIKPYSMRKNRYIDTSSKTLAAGIQFIFNDCKIYLVNNGNTYRCVRYNDEDYSNGLVIKNNIIISNKNDTYVYDISTDDGTFVTALGNIVLHNTDGLAIDKWISEEETNKWLDQLMINQFGIDENYMQMELDIVGPAYFCAMKNYVVEIEGHTHLHGSSLKSSRNCYVQDRARDLAIEYWFNNKPMEEVIREAYDFTGLELKDFEYRIRLNKDLDEYDDKTGQVAFLAAQYEHLTHSKPAVDTTIPYIITCKPLTDPKFKKFYEKKTGENYKFIKLAKDISEIDISYYNKQIDKMLNKFNISRVKQQSLFIDIGLDDIPDKVKLDKVNHDFE